MLFFNTTIDGLQLGLCFAVLALGLYISYSILDFPDLSVDGTFPLGGVVGTIFMYRMGINPVIAIIMSFIVGMLAGFITGDHDVDAEWDTYVEEMKRLGIERYVELKQIAWDLIH